MINNGKIYSNSNLQCNPGSACTFNFNLNIKSRLKKCCLNFVLEDDQGKTLIHCRSDQQEFYPNCNPGTSSFSILIESLNLEPGYYLVWFRIYGWQDNEDLIYDSEKYILNILGHRKLVHGFIYTKSQWKTI